MTNETESKVNGLTFKEWLAKVDAVLLSRVGMTHTDLSDFESFDSWDSGMTPEEGAEVCIAADDMFDGEDFDADDGDDYYDDHDPYGGGSYIGGDSDLLDEY